MSVDVRNFLDNSGGSNFTESVPRLPPQGEENEHHSTGGHSAKSSSSHKSQHSGKSLGSNKAPPAVSHSPSATPRKSHQSSATTIGAPVVEQQNGVGETEAPLGFEPEGSSQTPPPCPESSTPPPGRWMESLENLLEDADGVRLFRTYLDEQQCGNLFEFYFAWKYLNDLDASEQKGMKHLIKTMFKVYIKGDKGDRKLVTIKTELKEAIVKRMADRDFQRDIYDQVKDEVMDRLKRQYYPAFLKSDVYAQFVAATAAAAAESDGGKSNSSSNSSGSNSARQMSTSALLPTLHEDRELDLKMTLPESLMGIPCAAMPQALPLTPDTIRLTERLRQDFRGVSEDRHVSSYPQDSDTTAAAVNPYHTYASSYLPISAIDSERQSLSSDALTDDTLSVTDSSVDGYPMYSNKKSLKRYHMKLSKIAQRNPDVHPQPAGFQPRTDRMTKISSLAESEPAKFAGILIERLQAIVDGNKDKEMVQSRLNAISESEDADDSQALVGSSAAATGGGTTSHHATTLNQLLLAMQQGTIGGPAGASMDDDIDNDAQGILDMHCKRIWEKSGQHSPTKSPHSPPPMQDLHSSSSRRAATLPRMTTLSTMTLPPMTVRPPVVAASIAMPIPAMQKSTAGRQHGLLPASSYFTADHQAVAAAAVSSPTIPMLSSASALFQRDADTAGHALRQMQNHAYGLHYMATAAAQQQAVQQQAVQQQAMQQQAMQQQTMQQQTMQQQAMQQQAMPLMHHQQLQQQLISGLRHQQQLVQPNRLQLHHVPPALFSAGSVGSAFKPVPTVVPAQQALPPQQLLGSASSQSKVMEWINRNEEITQASSAGGHNSDSEKASSSHKRSSHKSGSTTASPRQHRPKSSSHSKKLQGYAATIPDFASMALLGAGPATMALPSRSAIEEMAKRLDERHLSNQLAAMAGASKLRPSTAAPLPASSSKERKGTAGGGPFMEPQRVAPTSSIQQPPQLRVAYYLNDQPIPYSTTVPVSDITLLKFKELVKELIAKRGTYRYFFKKANEDELGSDVTHFFEEVTQDSMILPKWEGKVIGYVKKVD